MRRIKVLHIIPSLDEDSGGPSSAVKGYIRASVNNADIDMLTLKNRLTAGDIEKIKTLLKNGQLYLFDSCIKGHGKFSVRMWVWVFKNISNYNIVHIHALFSPTSTFCAKIARLKKIPYILRPLGTLSNYSLNHRHLFLKRFYFRIFEKSNIQHASFMHFTSLSEAEEAQSILKISSYKIIPIPIESTPCNHRNADCTIRNSILFLSRIDPKKGLELLIDAYAAYCKIHPKIILTIAGNGDSRYNESIRTLVEKLGLRDRVKFLGFVSGKEKENLLKEALCLALFSRHENFGIAVVEAMASGLPVVISREVALSKDIQNADAGIVVQRRIGDIVDALSELTENRLRWEQISENGIHFVQSKFSYEKIGVDLLTAYQEIKDKK